MQSLHEVINDNQALDENDWPIGFFEETAGSIPDFPEREHQGEYEIRLELVDNIHNISNERVEPLDR